MFSITPHSISDTWSTGLVTLMPLAQDPPYQIWTASSSDILVLATCLHLFDESVVWLTSRGLSSQWGSEPLKNDPAHVKKVEKLIEVGPARSCSYCLVSNLFSVVCFVQYLSPVLDSKVQSSLQRL